MKWKRGWAHVEIGHDPRKDKWWWAFDVFRTRKEAIRCGSIGEKIVRVEYRFPRRKK